MKYIFLFIGIIFLNSCGVQAIIINPAFTFNTEKTIRDGIEHKKGRNIGPFTYTKKQRDRINK